MAGWFLNKHIMKRVYSQKEKGQGEYGPGANPKVGCSVRH